MTPRERFDAKWIEDENGCHVWQASKDGKGYGFFRHEGGMRRAHRIAYMWDIGPIPNGLVLDHLCRNRACVNSRHLEAVTSAENSRRGNSLSNENREKTHCPKGHEYTEGNTLTCKGKRYCRRCKQAYEAARYQRRKLTL